MQCVCLSLLLLLNSPKFSWEYFEAIRGSLEHYFHWHGKLFLSVYFEKHAAFCCFRIIRKFGNQYPLSYLTWMRWRNFRSFEEADANNWFHSWSKQAVMSLIQKMTFVTYCRNFNFYYCDFYPFDSLLHAL